MIITHLKVCILLYIDISYVYQIEPIQIGYADFSWIDDEKLVMIELDVDVPCDPNIYQCITGTQSDRNKAQCYTKRGCEATCRCVSDDGKTSGIINPSPTILLAITPSPTATNELIVNPAQTTTTSISYTNSNVAEDTETNGPLKSALGLIAIIVVLLIILCIWSVWKYRKRQTLQRNSNVNSNIAMIDLNDGNNNIDINNDDIKNDDINNDDMNNDDAMNNDDMNNDDVMKNDGEIPKRRSDSESLYFRGNYNGVNVTKTPITFDNVVLSSEGDTSDAPGSAQELLSFQ